MAKAMQVFDENVLETFKTMEEVIAYANSIGVNTQDNEADGIFSLDIIDDKDVLAGTPFMLLSWRFNKGTWGEFVSCEIMDNSGNHAILNDGSSGICKQLRDLTDYRTENGHPTPSALRYVKSGVKASRYTHEMEDGTEIQAVTYYLQY
jgi:hypothetical protein